MPERHYPIHPEVLTSLAQPVLIFLTICSSNRKQIFARQKAVNILLITWTEANQWKIGRYVIMPDHIHLFCSPDYNTLFTLDKWIRFWKSMVAKRWPWPDEKPIWQKNYWDRQIRKSESYQEKWDYVLNNPVRHKLVEAASQWPFQGELNVISW